MKNTQRINLKKQNIINALLEDEMLSTGKIASMIRSDQYSTSNYLHELLKENKVIKIETPNASYWKVNFKKIKIESNNTMLKKIKKEVIK